MYIIYMIIISILQKLQYIYIIIIIIIILIISKKYDCEYSLRIRKIIVYQKNFTLKVNCALNILYIHLFTQLCKSQSELYTFIYVSYPVRKIQSIFYITCKSLPCKQCFVIDSLDFTLSVYCVYSYIYHLLKFCQDFAPNYF